MIHVQLGSRSYDIALAGDVANIGQFLTKRVAGRSAFVVTDENTVLLAEHVTSELSNTGFNCRLAAVPAGENSKCLAAAAYLYERLAWMPAERTTIVVAVGGGVVGDLAGFVAATYNRGLPFVIVPTTLLAMVDSSVGGKVGINLPQGKNLVGAFYQPAGVWIDPTFLATLPDRDYRSGLAEVVKYGLGQDAELFQWLATNSSAILEREPKVIQHIVQRCCELKARIVEQDEREERGQRIVLNLGHTFAHAFETVGNYHWTHGEAVAAGLVCACRLADEQKLLAEGTFAQVIRLLRQFGLPTSAPTPPQVDDWMSAMKRDKKVVGGQLRFVLPVRIGQAQVVENVAEDLLRAALSG